jgi:hypothetical protein
MRKEKEKEMTAQSQAIHTNEAQPSNAYSNRNSLYKLGGAAALLILLTALAEILITFLPGGYTTAETVIDWFRLLQDNPFLGLRNLGLLNIVMITLGIPMILALYVAHRRANPTYAALAMILSFIGDAVFYATNRAFSMLALSHQYTAAATEAQRMVMEAAGQAMLLVGQSHVPGTYLAFCLGEIGSIVMGFVMLRGRIFSTATACVGIVGFGFLFLFDSLSSFVPSSHDVILIFAMIGGIATMVWYLLIARRFFQLGRDDRGERKA